MTLRQVIQFIVAAGLLAVLPSLKAQTNDNAAGLPLETASAQEQDPNSIDEPADVTEALDRALTDLRRLEAGSTENRAQSFNNVRSLLEYANSYEPGNRRAGFYRSRLLVLANRDAEAINGLITWTKSRVGQNDWEAHLILGQVYYRMEFYKLAKPILEKAIQLNQHEFQAFRWLALCDLMLLEYESAVTNARSAIQLAGTDVDAGTYLLLADALVRSERWDEAAQAARYAKRLALTALREGKPKKEVFNALDKSLNLLVSITQARIKAEPNTASLYLEMSRLHQEMAQLASLTVLNRALEWSDAALQKVGDRPPEGLLIDNIGLLISVGRFESARKQIQRTLDLYPNSQDAQRMLRSLEASNQTGASAEVERRPP